MAYGRYTRYFTIQGYGCSLNFNPSHWSELRETPIWLELKSSKGDGSKWKYPENARPKLSRLENEIPSRVIRYEDALLVPIYLPIGAEKDDVLHSIEDQITEVIELLKK
jgi:hypothetical protein